MQRLDESLAFAKTVVEMMHHSDIKYPATALAYYSFVSFVPLLLLVFFVIGRDVAVDIYARLPRFVTPGTQELIYEALTTASGRTGAAVLAVVVLTWGGVNIAEGFLTVVGRIEDQSEQPFATQVRDGAVVLAALTIAILALLLLSMLFAGVTADFIGVALGFAVLLVVLTVALLPLYYVPSRVLAAPSAALPGAFATACGWTALHAGIRIYTANAAQYAIYGVLSGVILILTAIYVAAVILMLGVVVNAVLASGADVQPADSRDPREG